MDCYTFHSALRTKLYKFRFGLLRLVRWYNNISIQMNMYILHAFKEHTDALVAATKDHWHEDTYCTCISFSLWQNWFRKIARWIYNPRNDAHSNPHPSKDCFSIAKTSLHWRYNERDDISNDQPHDSLLNILFRCRSRKTSKIRVAGLCAGNSPVTGEFPTQRASNTENVSIWWCHHAVIYQIWTQRMPNDQHRKYQYQRHVAYT